MRPWKTEPQRLADQTGLSTTVTHLPPGTGTWNCVERRLFAFVSQNWRGKPLLRHQVIVQLFTGLDSTPSNFHGEWNHIIAP